MPVKTYEEPAIGRLSDAPAEVPADWNDLFLRKSLSDRGNEWTMSPDIIPNGPVVVGDPQAAFGTAASYGKDEGKKTVFLQPNYFYVRAKNSAPGAQTGTVYLYYCPENLFLFPSLWKNQQMKTSSGQESINVSAAKKNDIAVTGEGFTYIPPDQIHSCLIARLTTPTHPNPLPEDGEFTTFEQLANYISGKPDMAWRNVALVDNGIPTWTRTFTLDTTSLPPSTLGTFLIGISFKSLAVGSELAFSAGTPIPSGPDKGHVIQFERARTSQPSASLGDRIITIPGGYKTEVTYSYWAKEPIMKGWNVQFYAILIKTPGQAVALENARPIHQLGIPGLENHPLLAGDPPLEGVFLGDVSTGGV